MPPQPPKSRCSCSFVEKFGITTPPPGEMETSPEVVAKELSHCSIPSQTEKCYQDAADSIGSTKGAAHFGKQSWHTALTNGLEV